ncbi:MAG TPA: hypothetical protein VLT88_05060 [Desulfosarcina sp.]|nr:hypothetical protein [Desulfosarcina sp.]
MHQIDLFDRGAGDSDPRQSAAFPIKSGRVGAIRFGSTDVSYTLLHEVLTDLAARVEAVDKPA